MPDYYMRVTDHDTIVRAASLIEHARKAYHRARRELAQKYAESPDDVDRSWILQCFAPANECYDCNLMACVELLLEEERIQALTAGILQELIRELREGSCAYSPEQLKTWFDDRMFEGYLDWAIHESNRSWIPSPNRFQPVVIKGLFEVVEGIQCARFQGPACKEPGYVYLIAEGEGHLLFEVINAGGQLAGILTNSSLSNRYSFCVTARTYLAVVGKSTA